MNAVYEQLDQDLIPEEQDHHVGNACIRALLQGAVLDGHDPEAILAQAELPATAYTDPHATLDGKQFLRLLLTIREVTQDVFMGFLESPGKLGMEAAHINLWVQAETLGEAIRNSTRLREQFRNDVQYDYLIDEQKHCFTLGISGYQFKPDVDPFIFYWARLMLIYRNYCWLIGRRIKLNQVNFAIPAPPADYGDIHGIFHCQVLFGQQTNALCFDRHHLHAPVIRTESELAHGDMIKNYPDWFEVPGYDYSWSRQVEEILLRFRHSGLERVTIEAVAKVVNVSSRTLRRKLQQENEYFQTIKDRLRLNQAIRLLVTTDIPVTQIATQVGFAEPGNFTRAFIHWTQQTPSEYRKQHTSDKAVMEQALAPHR